MPLTLVPPGARIKFRGGKRYANRYFLVRWKDGDGDHEVSTKTANATAAARFKAELELRLLDDRVPEPGEEITFARAADLYVAWRDPGKADRKRIDRLKAALAGRMLSTVTLADLHDAANRLHPTRSPATRNREVLRPAAAILHYAADNQLRPWLRVKLFREARPRTRAVTQDVARAVVNSVPPPTYRRQRSAKWLARAAATHAKKRLLLLWLFRQGMRISDALRVRGECIDMERRTVAYRIGKADRDVVKPLHDEVWEFLANDAPAPGWLFPWRTKSGVYKWLRPMCRALGIAFTPHMARHSVGKWLNEEGASLRTIMDTLDHADPKSSVRYQSTDIEVIRATGRRLGKLVSAGNAKGETD